MPVIQQREVIIEDQRAPRVFAAGVLVEQAVGGHYLYTFTTGSGHTYLLCTPCRARSQQVQGYAGGLEGEPQWWHWR